MEEPKKETHLEELNRKLYSKHYVPKHTRAKLDNKNYGLASDWEDEDQKSGSQKGLGKTLDLSQKDTGYWGPGSDAMTGAGFAGGNTAAPEIPSEFQAGTPPKKKSSFAMILIIAALFFISSLTYAYFVFMKSSGPVSGDDVAINLIGPVSVGGGEELSVDVVIQNNNVVPLELVDLIIDYPPGTKKSDDLVTDLKRDRIPLGSIAPGDISRKTITAALFGEENSSQKIIVSISYRLQGSKAIFEKQKPFDIVLSASPVRLVVDGLREISSGQEIELTARLSSNSIKPLENVMVVAKYPFGFTFKESNIKPSIDNNIWFFKTLDPEEEKVITIKGTVQGQNEEDRIFRFSTGIKSDSVNNELGIIWGTILHETTIKKAFVNLNILVNGSQNETIVVSSGQIISGVIDFINNTNDTLRDIEIELELLGNVLDETSVTANAGFYRSIDNTIMWSSESDSKFKELEPRNSYKLSFNLASYDLSQGKNLVDVPEIRMQAKVSATRVSEEDAEETISTDTFAVLKVLSDVFPKAYTAYKEGPFTNFGPIPPKPETDTTYTLVFEIANSSNDLDNIQLEGILPSYVTWNGMVSPEGADVFYDEATHRMVWNAGSLKAGIGYITAPRRLYVNVTLKPSISQIGVVVDLMRDIKLTALDTFTKTNIVKNIESVTTEINNEVYDHDHKIVSE